LRVGLGIEHCICPNLTVTADYIYTYYGHVSVDGIGDASGSLDDGDGEAQFTPNGLVSRASSRLSTNAAMIGVKWYFL
jgi:opacity protein-like surface antigen